MSNYLVISAVGEDRPGIVKDISKFILDNDGNIVESRMTVLGGEFALMMLVSGSDATVEALENKAKVTAEALGLTLITKGTGPRGTQQKRLPYLAQVVAMDHPGIVHVVTDFFAQKNINIEELITNSYAAAHTGTPMFSLQLNLGVSAEMNIGGLRSDFVEFCDALNLDGSIEAFK